MIDIEKAIAAQKEYCEINKAPHFAPLTGRCWNCRRNIYEGERGYSVERAGSSLITGCPHCHRSYCD